MALSPSLLGGGGLGGNLGDAPIYAPGAGPTVSMFNHPAPTAGEYPFTGHKYVGDLPGWTYDPWADTYYPNSKQYAQYATKSGLAGASPNLFQQLLPSILAGSLKGLGSELIGGTGAKGTGSGGLLGALAGGVKTGGGNLWNYLTGSGDSPTNNGTSFTPTTTDSYGMPNNIDAALTAPNQFPGLSATPSAADASADPWTAAMLNSPSNSDDSFSSFLGGGDDSL